MSPNPVDYLIVGGGVFGASTAFHLSQQKPSASIVLIDRTPFPCPIAASHDINKAVRADYGDMFYCKLGLKTLERWRTDPLFKKYFHQSGMITITNGPESLGRKIIDNFKTLNASYEAEVFGPEEMKTRFEGIFANTDYSHVEEIYYNPLSGWAEAARAVEATTKAAIDGGVRYIEASISKLLLADGVCTGVRTTKGETYHADRVILSTGAYTAKLLADTAPDEPGLHAGRRITAAAVCEAATDVTQEQKEIYKNMPVFVLDDEVTQGILTLDSLGRCLLTSRGETMPITPNNQMKFIRDVTWKNTVKHHASGRSISVPETTPTRSQWAKPSEIPRGLRREIDKVIKGIHGKTEGANLQPNTLRMCWDGLTQDNNWYITPHPRCKNLYIATGGSFHGWKFLPILGEFVVQMLDGELPDEEKERWAWDTNLEGLPKNPLEPARELRDIVAEG
ncbi:MAG: hypothetical protein LQ352_007153 [Teloschistes flavicans]|nr:MAG: hypothetical protein LQ352_007153 [Teloschistes flavicans]